MQIKTSSHALANINDAISIRYNNLVYELKQAGKKPIVLSLGEAYFDLPLLDFEVLDYPNDYHYSHSRGLSGLRKKLSEFYFQQYRVKSDPDHEIIISTGSKTLIYFVFCALLNADDEVLIPEPAWVSYTEQVKLCRAIPIGIPYHEPVQNYEKYITNKTRVIVINNPNNPTGKVYTLAELELILMLAKKHDLYILADEVYSDFVKAGKFHSLGILDPNKEYSIICNSISKNMGISGWRIGYCITNPILTEQLLKLNQHIITCAPTILQDYILKYFDRLLTVTIPQIKSLIAIRQRISAFISHQGLKMLDGEATFYFFLDILPSKLSSEAFCLRLLQQYQIAAVPGIGYGKTCDNFIRISIGTETETDICQAILKIKSLIHETSDGN